MSRISDFDPDHALRTWQGAVNPRRAAPMLPVISDGSGNEVANASEILFTGGVVTEPEDGVAQVTIGGAGGGGGGLGTSSGTAIAMLNNAGQDLLPGDVVVVDETADNAVTVTTTAGDIRIAGVVQEPIADGGTGLVLFNGYTTTINAPTAVRGEYAKTATTAAQADSTADREAGSFAVYVTGTDFPDFITASMVTEQAVLAEALDITLPTSIPLDRTLFLGLWLEDGVSSVDIPGWTLIGAEAGFNYFYRISTGGDAAAATWTGGSVAVAIACLLHPAVSLAVPIEDHDYENTTAAAAVSSLADVAHYAIAGVRAEVVSPGSGFTFIGSGTGEFNEGGDPATVVQGKHTTNSGGFAESITLDSAVTIGNVLLAVGVRVGTSDATVFSGFTSLTSQQVVSDCCGNGAASARVFAFAKIADSTSAGPFSPLAESAYYDWHLYEIANADLDNIDILSAEHVAGSGTTDTLDLGDFTSVTGLGIFVGAEERATDQAGHTGSWSQASPWTEDSDTGNIFGGTHVGVGHADVTAATLAASWDYTETAGGQSVGEMAGIAVFFGAAVHTVAGSLAGKYIGHDASVTSPFSGAGKELDAIFAWNLLADAKPSALLYGPDLLGESGGGEPTADAHIADTTDAHDASAISVADAGGYYTGTDVEAVLQELAAKDIGYQAHGSMGATETFSALIGWHSGTFNADCTFTFSGATSGIVASLVLELAEDGTGGWDPTWPGSVIWPGGVAPTHDTTAGSTTIYLFESRDGGTTWYGFQAGGGGTTVTYATPTIVLGTAAAAGAADSVIRSDATIVAFDATVPVTQAFGDVAATGSAAVAARRDHRHGMPTTPAGGPILITDTPAGSPLVFADLLQNEAGTDLLYADTW